MIKRGLGVVLLGVTGVMVCTGCGSAPAPGRTDFTGPGTSSSTQSTAVPSSLPASSRPSTLTSSTSPVAGAPGGSYSATTIDLATAIEGAAHAQYVTTYGTIILNNSQYGMTLQMTDLAQGRKLIAGARAGHPQWAAVPVALVKVPYTEKQMLTAEHAVSDATSRKYQLVSVGFGTCDYLSVTSSDPKLKDPTSGKNARATLARTLSHALKIRVGVTYSPPAHAD